MNDGFTVIQKPWANVPQGSSRARLTIALASHDPACLADRLCREFGGSESDEEPPGVAAADQRAAECSRVRCDFIHPGNTDFPGGGFAEAEESYPPPSRAAAQRSTVIATTKNVAVSCSPISSNETIS